MAAPSYTHDLVTIDEAETTTGYSHWGGGNIQLGAGVDFSIQGVNCVDGKISSTEKGPYFDNAAGITLPAGAHIYVWAGVATPGLTDTLANRGTTIGIGSSSTAYCLYHVEGNDTYGAAGRVTKCYPIDYTVRTSNLGGVPYRTVSGSPTANPRVFGMQANITGTVKSSNVALDAIRYGTGAYLTDGELVSSGDASDNPCTFDGFSVQNDRNEAGFYNRWGILTKIGNSYELQGAFVLGQDNTGAPARCIFSDSDRNIVIPDTVHSSTDFSKIVVDNASTEVYWTNINVEALGENNRGSLTVNNGLFVINGGSFTGFGATSLASNSAATNRTWRGCEAVTTNGATLTSCLFDKTTATSALIADAVDNITDCTFVGDNTSYAVDIPTEITSNQSVVWDNAFDVSTYASVNGSTGSEVIRCNVAAGVTLTINVAQGASTPTYHNVGLGTVVVASSVPITITVLNENKTPRQDVRVYAYRTDTFAQIINGVTDVNGQITENYTSATPQGISGWARDYDLSGVDYTSEDFTGTITSTGFDQTLTLEVE